MPAHIIRPVPRNGVDMDYRTGPAKGCVLFGDIG